MARRTRRTPMHAEKGSATTQRPKTQEEQDSRLTNAGEVPLMEEEREAHTLQQEGTDRHSRYDLTLRGCDRRCKKAKAKTTPTHGVKSVAETVTTELETKRAGKKTGSRSTVAGSPMTDAVTSEPTVASEQFVVLAPMR